MRPKPKSRDEFQIAIICALPLEADAVEALFDEKYDTLGHGLGTTYGKQDGDPNCYTTGRIGQHPVVLCYMAEMGKRCAASVSSSLRISWRGVRIALVVGVCGGVPFTSTSTTSKGFSHGPDHARNEIILGDVLVSDGVVEYDFGRRYPGGFARKNGVSDVLGRPNREIRSLLAGLRTKQNGDILSRQIYRYLKVLQKRREGVWDYPGVGKDVLFEASYQHKHRQPSVLECVCEDSFSALSIDQICEKATKSDCDELGCVGARVQRARLMTSGCPMPAVHIGKIGSADTVMKSGEHRDELAKREGIIGLEMEGAGVWDNISCVIIKGVCDYADSHKNKGWQCYAAATAASCARTFLDYWNPATGAKVNKSVPVADDANFEEVQVLITSFKAQTQAAAMFILFTVLCCRKIFMLMHNQLAKCIGSGSEQLAILEDAHFRRFTIPLDTINSWELFDLILERHFVDMPGYQKVKAKIYVLEDSVTREEVNQQSDFKVCFGPGRRVLMSIRFHIPQNDESTCPSCHAVNVVSEDLNISCTACDLNYRRITDLDEENDDSLSTNRKNATSSIPRKRKRDSMLGLEIPTKFDTLNDLDMEGVCEFKRVQIVTPSSTTLNTSSLETEITWSDFEFSTDSLLKPLGSSGYETHIDVRREQIKCMSDKYQNAISGIDEKRCPLCPGKFRKRGTMIRHISDKHFPQVIFFCTWPDCRVQMNRRDRMLNHVRNHKSSQRLGDGLPPQGFDMQELPVPSECPVCHGGTDSWKFFYYCVSTHFIEVSSDDQNNMIFQ